VKPVIAIDDEFLSNPKLLQCLESADFLAVDAHYRSLDIAGILHLDSWRAPNLDRELGDVHLDTSG
jgi:hypothetical protein